MAFDQNMAAITYIIEYSIDNKILGDLKITPMNVLQFYR
jgi:hypothetical protein